VLCEVVETHGKEDGVERMEIEAVEAWGRIEVGVDDVGHADCVAELAAT
jgi:hypothetical protein